MKNPGSGLNADTISRPRQEDRGPWLAPKALAPYIAPKGSVTLDGVSLTVNEVVDGTDGCRFGVNIIPHTREVTTLGNLSPERAVNIEIDTLARYVARLKEIS